MEIYESSRKNKKYMVLNPTTGKMVSFGQKGYDDYHSYKQKYGLAYANERRRLFRKRNWKWAYAKPYSPAWLAYYFLWP